MHIFSLSRVVWSFSPRECCSCTRFETLTTTSSFQGICNSRSLTVRPHDGRLLMNKSYRYHYGRRYCMLIHLAKGQLAAACINTFLICTVRFQYLINQHNGFNCDELFAIQYSLFVRSSFTFQSPLLRAQFFSFPLQLSRFVSLHSSPTNYRQILFSEPSGKLFTFHT